jgi:hypothetical protein
MVCILSTKVKEISTSELKDKSRVASSGYVLRDQKQSICKILVAELRANSFATGSSNSSSIDNSDNLSTGSYSCLKLKEV